jgi:hypothetical protein
MVYAAVGFEVTDFRVRDFMSPAQEKAKVKAGFWRGFESLAWGHKVTSNQ